MQSNQLNPKNSITTGLASRKARLGANCRQLAYRLVKASQAPSVDEPYRPSLATSSAWHLPNSSRCEEQQHSVDVTSHTFLPLLCWFPSDLTNQLFAQAGMGIPALVCCIHPLHPRIVKQHKNESIMHTVPNLYLALSRSVCRDFVGLLRTSITS